METIEKIIAGNIRRIRETLGMSRPMLAEKSGVAPRTIQNIEEGRSCSIRNLKKIADALGVSLIFLMHENGGKKKYVKKTNT